MKKQHNLTILFFFQLIFVGKVSAQFNKCVVIDAKTNNPIPYVSIKTNNYFTVTDTVGNFVLPDSISQITASCVGYQTLATKVDKKVSIISLKQSIYELNEVLVKPLTYRDFYLCSFAPVIEINLEQNPFDANFFYREFTKINNKYIDFNEAFGLYHFEGMGNYSNVKSSSFIIKIDNVRSLNVLNDKKQGLHQINWLAAANNLSKYLILNYVGFYDCFDTDIEKVYKQHDLTNLVEVSFKPKTNKINYLISKQSRRRNIYAGAIGSEGKVYIDNESFKLKKFIFSCNNFNDAIRGYNPADKRFHIKNINGELNFTEDKNNKTVPLFLGCNVSYSLDDNPNEIIEKRLEFYFSNFDLSQQKTDELEKKYKTKIVDDFPIRACYYSRDYIFTKAFPYNEEFWKKELPYPKFYDIEKVRNDLKSQGIDMEKKFKEFTNKYN